MRPLALKPGEGVSVDNPVGGVLTFKVTSDQSGGQLTAIETVAAPGEGPPLHVHSDEDEFIYILEGAFKVKLENDLITATPGSFVFIPRGTPHAWQNVSDASARFFAGVMPAAIGFEGFFARYAAAPKSGAPKHLHGSPLRRRRSRSSDRRSRNPTPTNPPRAH